MKQYHLLSILALLVFFSCKSEKQKLIEQIAANENKLFNDSTKTLNPKIANEELMAYQKYVNSFPNDSASPSYLFKAADLAHGIGKNQEAIDLYKMFIAKYPNHAKATQSLFLQAFIYDSELMQKDSAKRIYREFLEKYPTNALAASARASIDQIEMGLSDEELVKLFESRLDSSKTK